MSWHRNIVIRHALAHSESERLVPVRVIEVDHILSVGVNCLKPIIKCDMMLSCDFAGIKVQNQRD